MSADNYIEEDLKFVTPNRSRLVGWVAAFTKFHLRWKISNATRNRMKFKATVISTKLNMFL